MARQTHIAGGGINQQPRISIDMQRVYGDAILTVVHGVATIAARHTFVVECKSVTAEKQRDANA
jgi:hypothetical protein